MAINFPDNPTTGSTHTAGGKNYLYDSDTTAWAIADAGFIAATDAAPTDVSSGTLWFNSTDASLYMYYDDGTSKQWIAVSGPAGAPGTDGTDGTQAQVTTQNTAPSSPIANSLWLILLITLCTFIIIAHGLQLVEVLIYLLCHQIFFRMLIVHVL